MPSNNDLTTRDHLEACGYTDEWLVTLADMIVEYTGNDVAIAAGRALDLARNKRFGKSIGMLMQGYLAMCDEMDNGHDLSPNQKETIRQVLFGIAQKVMKYFPDAGIEIKKNVY